MAGWTDAERREFEVEVAPLARELGYEYRTDRLADEPDPPEDVPSTPRHPLDRIRRRLGR